MYQRQSRRERQDGLAVELRALGLVLRALERRIESGCRGRGEYWSI
jgi:hypothetical protein